MALLMPCSLHCPWPLCPWGTEQEGEEGQIVGCLPLPSFFLPALPLLLLTAPTHGSGTPSIYAHHAAALWDSLNIPGEPDSASSPAWDLQWLSVTPGCQAEVLASFGLLALGTSHSVPLWPQAQALGAVRWASGGVEASRREVPRGGFPEGRPASSCPGQMWAVPLLGWAMCLSVVHVLSSADLAQPWSRAPHANLWCCECLRILRECAFSNISRNAGYSQFPGGERPRTHRHRGIGTHWRRPSYHCFGGEVQPGAEEHRVS